MQNETNERLTAIEMKLAYMEDFVNQIQNVAVEQAKTIDKLKIAIADGDRGTIEEMMVLSTTRRKEF